METISRNLDLLVAFHCVALEKSFSQAAATLGTSKAMVSKQVKQLETYLRSQLFLRTTRSVSLTEEGLALFSYSQKIFDLSDDAAKRLRDLSEHSSGTIKLSAPVSMGDIFFPSILEELKAIIPNVDFEIDLSNETRDLAKDRIDFAIRATEVNSPDLIARPLGRIKDVICVNPEYLNHLAKDSKRLHHPNGLATVECIINSHRKRWNTWTFTKGSNDVSVDVKGAYATNQYSMARGLCLKGFGVAKIPHYLVADDLTKGTLIQLFKEFEISTHAIYLVYNRSEYANKKKQITRDTILKWFKRNSNYFAAPPNR